MMGTSRFCRTLIVTVLSAVVSVLAIISMMSAQTPSTLISKRNPSRSARAPVVSRASAFAVSARVSDLAPLKAVARRATSEPLPEWEDFDIDHDSLRDAVTTGSGDGALQDSAPVSHAIEPALSFEGLSSQDNVSVAGIGLSPPDTNGDVGPNHYVQVTNVLFRVWDKNGNPLTAALRLSSLFVPLGGACTLPPGKGDPVVLYDPLADRWLVSQLGFVTSASAPYFECIAISQTSDPTGAYYLYAFQIPNNEFPDYPKLGVWPDGYYMTVNQFTNGGPQNGTGAYAFNRARMLEGDPDANLIYFDLDRTSHPEGIVGMLPSDFDGLIAPPEGRPNTFAYFTSVVFGDPSDGLRLFDFHADFSDPSKSTFIERDESPVPVAAFSPTSPLGRRDILQPPLPPPFDNTTNALDSIPDRLMHRLQYRNTGNAESLVANHTVGAPGSTILGTFRAGIRYYQLSSSGGGPFAVAEQATYAPNDGLNRWMGSAATDNQGNLAVGFSTSSTNSFPSVAFAGRLASDLPGGLFQGENTIVQGSGVQTSAGNRWGDYSALTVDPSDDCTFWYTNEYYSAASQVASPVGWLTRVGHSKFSTCTAPPQGTLQGSITSAGAGAPIAGAQIRISNGFSQYSIANGTYSRLLPSGVYDVTVSKLGFAATTVTRITITDGITTELNVQLEGAPAVLAGSTAIRTERFSPPNNAIDPGETVTLDFTLRNIGFGGTRNLTATLLPTGGVLEPSAPQQYGAISPFGGTATQPFTFRADPALGCGGSITATLRLEDGPVNLGVVTFKLQLAGGARVLLAENFDSVAAPNLPPGWVASNLDASPVLWATSSSTSDTQPFNAFVSVPAVVSDKTLVSPSFAVQSESAQLSFRHLNIFEPGNDGGVLEISLDGGAFVDILSAGGSFVTNGYDSTISTSSGNPIGGRRAWSGSSPSYRTTQVNLPAAAAGRMVRLRWRMGSNSSISVTGSVWRVDTITVTELVANCTFNIAGTASITAESFSPPNGVIDPGETVTVAVALHNSGAGTTSDLVATLLPTGGVLDPSSPQSYGQLSSTSGTVVRPFTFRADPALGCGGTLTATLHLQDGSTDLGAVTFKFSLAGTIVTVFAEDFDSVVAPALPAGWVATSLEASPVLWTTVPSLADTPPNDALVAAPAVVSLRRLDSPAIPIQTASAQLRFRTWYILQPGFDGGVLEISIDGGPFVDILDAGGSFVENGYNNTISSAASGTPPAVSPLAGRQAWSMVLPGYVTVRVNLPAAAAGKMVKLRWTLGSDNSVASPGWRIDTISITEIPVPCTVNIGVVPITKPSSLFAAIFSGWYSWWRPPSEPDLASLSRWPWTVQEPV